MEEAKGAQDDHDPMNDLETNDLKDSMEEVPLVDMESDAYIDMVLSARQKKTSVNLPRGVPFVSNTKLLRQRKYIMTNTADHKHLFGQIDGSTYDRCERPDMEIHIITVQKIMERNRVLEKEIEYGINKIEAKDVHDAHIDVDHEQEHEHGNNIKPIKEELLEDELPAENNNEKIIYEDPLQIMFDTSKKIYILSEMDEDLMLLRLKRFREKKMMEELVLTNCICSFRLDEKDISYESVNHQKQRVWRRFGRETLQPELRNTKRMNQAQFRVNEVYDIEANLGPAAKLAKNAKGKGGKGGKGKRQPLPPARGKGVGMGTRK